MSTKRSAPRKVIEASKQAFDAEKKFPMAGATPEERVTKFNEMMKEAMDYTMIGMSAEPRFTQDGRVGVKFGRADLTKQDEPKS